MNRPARRATRDLEDVKRARMDTITLVPASLLPCKEQWRRCAGAVSSREALFIVPEGETPLRRAMRRLVPHLRAAGRQVTALPAGRFG